MENIWDSSDTSGGQKRGEKRKAEDAADKTDADMAQPTISKKAKETRALTLPPSQAMEQAAAMYRRQPQLQRVHLNDVADTAQDTANKQPKPMSGDTSAPAAVEGGPPRDYYVNLYCALNTYRRSGKQAAAAYLRAYFDCGITVHVPAISPEVVRASLNLAQQRCDRLVASLDDDHTGIKNDIIAAWAHSNAKAALQLLMPTQPEKVRLAMTQLTGYASL
ncbi:hypothetical protein LTR10_001226 [Elasticomyces elasticus]|nr:hypothetical protein LTR10_001226 [Elasticomyces elasticus]KAK4965407.1 hypothetical protein LTR42_012163 [Elasticomyces elasticus]